MAEQEEEDIKDVNLRGLNIEGRTVISETELTVVEANRLFLMIFGERISSDVLARWCNQGIRFSDDPKTSMGLVQHQGGPCGVLAPIQAFLLKYLLFSPEESYNALLNKLSNLDLSVVAQNEYVLADIIPPLSEQTKSRSLVRSMSEILFMCGRNEKAVIASLNILDGDLLKSVEGSKVEVIAKALEGLSIKSGLDLHKVLRVSTCTSQSCARRKLKDVLPIFRSRFGALLFLMSALLSRGLDTVEEDRDESSQPLVTNPFGQSSQEVVNLLISGSAVANIFDGNKDSGGVLMKGISTNVEVGFLTLSQFDDGYCEVGQRLKNPKWPIWVVGSESHYTVLFAADPKIQEDLLEKSEEEVRSAFYAKDEIGNGFISVKRFNQLVTEMNIDLPCEKVMYLCESDIVVWDNFWKVILDLHESLGGVKGSSRIIMRKKKVFDLYHFNGIAKSVVNRGQGSLSRSENQAPRPRLTKVTVSVTDQSGADSWIGESEGWVAQNELVDCISWIGESEGWLAQNELVDCISWTGESEGRLAKNELVDCIRTRWPGAVCDWKGEAPSIV